jgi:hypothetical protein
MSWLSAGAFTKTFTIFLDTKLKGKDVPKPDKFFKGKFDRSS